VAGVPVILWLSLALGAECPSVSAASESARQLLVEEANIEGAEVRLLDAEAGLGCGTPLSATEVAWYWVVRGAVEVSTGQEVEGLARLHAARRVAPGVWEPTLGDVLREQWTNVGDGVDGAITAVPMISPVNVDGTEAALPASVAPGLHLVQVVADGEVRWGAEVFVPEGEVLTLDFADVTLPIVAAPVEVDTSPPAQRPVAAHLGVGAGLALGPPFDPGSEEIPGERNVKPLLPVEAGLMLVHEALRVRAAGRATLLLNGRYVYADDAGEAAWSRFTIGGHLAVIGGRTHGAGGLVGLALPGRLNVHGIYRYAPADWWSLEVRPGVNVLTGGRPVEGQLDAVWALSL